MKPKCSRWRRATIREYLRKFWKPADSAPEKADRLLSGGTGRDPQHRADSYPHWNQFAATVEAFRAGIRLAGDDIPEPVPSEGKFITVADLKAMGYSGVRW